MTRVYISSTFKDLNQYRVAAYEACRQLGHVVLGMEDFAAQPEGPVEKVLAEVVKADIYLGIVAWSYGYIPASPANPEDLSITHLEFREARANRKPCLIFMTSDDAAWPASFMDSDPARLRQFRQELQRERVSYFSSLEDFHAKVLVELMQLERRAGRRPEPAPFDAFLSYNSSDRDAVRVISDQLVRDGVRLWWDVISLKPGDKWEKLGNDALSRAAKVVAFVGPSGVREWQAEEIEMAVHRQADDAGFRIIPVLLPGADSNSVPPGLRQFMWIAFSSLGDAAAYRNLLSAIHPAVTTREQTLNEADLELLADLLFRVVSRLRERPEMLSSLDGATFWAQARKIAPQSSTLEDLRKLKEELSSVPGPGPLWSAWIRNTRAPELAALMRHAAPAVAKPL
jgi:hypothetical protein